MASEVFIVSSRNDEKSAFSLWNLQTGNLMKSYKTSQQQFCDCLVRAGWDYLLTSQDKKQVINVWEWKKEQPQLKIVCPEKVSAISCPPDGNYCVVGLLDKIFIWQMATGNLMKILSRHYQNVNLLRSTDDGTHFVSAGDDNLVIVWSLASVLSGSNDTNSLNQQQSPLHIWSNHSLPVKDIYLTSGGVRCRVATCSLDQTCKLYDMASGYLLCSLLFNYGLSAVTMDPSERFLFVGGITGRIHAINVSGMRISKEQTIVEDSLDSNFNGHSKEITKLCVSSNGDTLLSGSADQHVRLWHIESGQCIKQIEFKGRVTNLEVFRPPGGVANLMSSRSLSPIGNFKRNLHTPNNDVVNSSSSEDIVPLVLKDIDKESLAFTDLSIKYENPDVDETALVMKIVAEKCTERQGEKEERCHKDLDSLNKSELKERVENLESLVRTLYAINANRIINELNVQDIQ